MHSDKIRSLITCTLIISLLFTPLNSVIASSTPLSSLDMQIENIRDLYSLNEGWNLSLKAPSSLSSQNAYLLSQVNKRWSKHLVSSSRISQKGTELTKGITLKNSAINEIKNTHGADASKRIEAWEKLSQAMLHLSSREKLTHVNNFFNRITFKSDQRNWGVNDYWTSPIEFLISNSGDCEDYAIAKYITLRTMGIGAENLRITYVKASNLGQAHMILAYYETLNEDPLILDNLNENILPATQRPDLIPVYAFNG